jgi:hypothetical protein
MYWQAAVEINSNVSTFDKKWQCFPILSRNLYVTLQMAPEEKFKNNPADTSFKADLSTYGHPFFPGQFSCDTLSILFLPH